MLQDVDGDKEILLGNKQLLGIFFLVVILLGVAFAGGYKVGQGSHKAPAPPDEASLAAGATSTGVTAGETHVTGEEKGSTKPVTAPETGSTDTNSEAPLGSRQTPASVSAPPARSTPPRDNEAPGPPPVVSHSGFTPAPGSMFLQVAAVQRDEAEAISDVLRKKGFRAHAVPKPGSKLYRVIIGPVRDAADLSTTRASLRNTGFREIIVQRY
jgi:cell division septation protein DedD